MFCEKKSKKSSKKLLVFFRIERGGQVIMFITHNTVLSMDDPSVVHDYYRQIYVIHTPTGPVWDADNVSKALFNEPDHIKGGTFHAEAREYVTMHIGLDGDRFVDWSTLSSELRRLFPDPSDDHRITWWMGMEK